MACLRVVRLSRSGSGQFSQLAMLITRSDGRVRVVKVDFWQGGKKAPTVHLKHGRGLVARYVFTHDCDSLDALKGFDLEGYSYDGEHSSDDVMVFARESAPPKKKARKA